MKMKFKPENHMQAIVNMIHDTLWRSSTPVHHEMASMLRTACTEWIEKIEQLESDYEVLLQVVQNRENGIVDSNELTEKLNKIIYK